MTGNTGRDGRAGTDGINGRNSINNATQSAPTLTIDRTGSVQNSTTTNNTAQMKANLKSLVNERNNQQ